MATVRGGNKAAAFIARLSRKLARPAVLKVGFLENATYPNGTPVAMIAAIQNFGAPSVGIPPRPFFSNMIAKKQSEWPKAIAGLLKANQFDLKGALEQMGFAIEGQLRQSIQDTNAPPLKPATISRKGFSKPLIGGGVTGGHMYNSVDHEVNIK